MDASEEAFLSVIRASLARGLTLDRAFAHFDVLGVGAVTPDQFMEGLRVRVSHHSAMAAGGVRVCGVTRHVTRGVTRHATPRAMPRDVSPSNGCTPTCVRPRLCCGCYVMPEWVSTLLSATRLLTSFAMPGLACVRLVAHLYHVCPGVLCARCVALRGTVAWHQHARPCDAHLGCPGAVGPWRPYWPAAVRNFLRIGATRGGRQGEARSRGGTRWVGCVWCTHAARGLQTCRCDRGGDPNLHHSPPCTRPYPCIPTPASLPLYQVRKEVRVAKPTSAFLPQRSGCPVRSGCPQGRAWGVPPCHVPSA